MKTTLLPLVVVLAAATAACYADTVTTRGFDNSSDTPTGDTSGDDAGTTPDPGSGGGGNPDAGAPVTGGPWCQVQAYVKSNCVSCHTAGGQSPAMDTYAELKGPSTITGQTVAQRASARLKTDTMPPGGGQSSAGSMFDAWIAEGYTQDDCSGGGGGTDSGTSTPTASPINWSAAAVCSSNKHWSGGSGSSMRPGEDCLGCHSFYAAGTVYPTPHEPNDCNGVTSVQVIITDSNGKQTTTSSNSAGNFYFQSSIGTAPYHVSIVSGGVTRSMSAALTDNLGCNSCHTPNGTNSAVGQIQGRIVKP